jgi:Rad3-related DNA helicase
MKPSEMLKEIKNVLGIELSEETPVQEIQEVALAQMKLENGTVLEAEAFEADNEVFIVTEDEKVALPVGEYTLEDGRILKVEQEGVIAEIRMEESEDEVAEESVEESEDLKEEEIYATKEELSEIRSMVEEIREMMKDKMSEVKEVSEAQELAEQLKEELSKPASEPITHSPEAEQKAKVLYAQKRALSTRDRVLQRIANS